MTACLLIFILGSKVQVYPQQAPRSVSPEVLKDKAVIFRLYAPDVKSVTVGGTWASPFGSVEMTKNDSGLFTARIGPLPSDMYVYSFSVDGVSTRDPNNNIMVCDGSYIESRLVIPGDRADLYDVKRIPHGRLNIVWYPSPSLWMDRRMIVYTPPGYERSNQFYPVLYLMHGAGGDEHGPLQQFRKQLRQRRAHGSDHGIKRQQA